jgi:hypothetical protein
MIKIRYDLVESFAVKLAAMHIINIPIEFEYEGIYFQGEFLSQSGTENVWQLRLYNYHNGQFVNYDTGWK